MRQRALVHSQHIYLQQFQGGSHRLQRRQWLLLLGLHDLLQKPAHGGQAQLARVLRAVEQQAGPHLLLRQIRLLKLVPCVYRAAAVSSPAAALFGDKSLQSYFWSVNFSRHLEAVHRRPTISGKDRR
jgi:hypothetical protein